MANERDNQGRPTPPTWKGDSSLVGKRLGVYEILEQVGKGGMGAVYRAKDRSLDRDVALKVLLPDLALDPEFEKRFVREARAAAKLDHSNIVQVYTAGRFENVLFIAMQFVHGKTLHDVVRERGKIPVAEALPIVRQVARALHAAHEIDLVHRDVKPNNIMIDESGRVKIMDFGLMRSIKKPDGLTQAGVFFGTPEYASPEQCDTAVVDGRSDIYSLGAVLYEMLTGRIPHVAETPLALFKKITDEEPTPLRSLAPEVPAEVEDLVQRMLAKSPVDRFASAAELARAIEKIEAGKVEPPRSRAWIGVAAGILLVAAAVLAWRFWPKPTAPVEPEKKIAAPAPMPEKINLVVFDFRNLRPTPENAWLEAALSDMLITALAQSESLKVPTRDQLLWKLKDLALAEHITEDNRRVLVAEFKAHAYVTGSFLTAAGGDVQITVNGYRLPGNETVFPAKKVQGREDKIFELFDKLAAAVLEGLKEGGAALASAPQPVSTEELAHPFRGPGERSAGAPMTETVAAKAPATGGDKSEKRRDKKAAEKLFKPMSDQELLKSWYTNRRSIEKAGFEEDEVVMLLETLRKQYETDEMEIQVFQKGLEDFNRCVEEYREQRKGGFAKIDRDSIEYECPGCRTTSRKFGRCGACEKYLVLKLKLPPRKEDRK